MCMMKVPGQSKVAVEEEDVTAVAGKGITNQNPLFRANKPKRAKAVNRSMRINKPH
jgi:hypothetical protein